MQRLISTLASGIVAAGLFMAAACGDNLANPAKDVDSGVVESDAAMPDARVDVDAGIDAPMATIAPCLDRPTDLPRPPSGQLPCELIPPGVGM